jgi:hypothetical protein
VASANDAARRVSSNTARMAGVQLIVERCDRPNCEPKPATRTEPSGRRLQPNQGTTKPTVQDEFNTRERKNRRMLYHSTCCVSVRVLACLVRALGAPKQAPMFRETLSCVSPCLVPCAPVPSHETDEPTAHRSKHGESTRDNGEGCGQPPRFGPLRDARTVRVGAPSLPPRRASSQSRGRKQRRAHRCFCDSMHSSVCNQAAVQQPPLNPDAEQDKWLVSLATAAAAVARQRGRGAPDGLTVPAPGHGIDVYSARGGATAWMEGPVGQRCSVCSWTVRWLCMEI